MHTKHQARPTDRASRSTRKFEAVGRAAKKHGKLMGIAGLYHRPDILDRVINELGARWVVGAHDVGLLSSGGRTNSDLLRSLQKD